MAGPVYLKLNTNPRSTVYIDEPVSYPLLSSSLSHRLFINCIMWLPITGSCTTTRSLDTRLSNTPRRKRRKTEPPNPDTKTKTHTAHTGPNGHSLCRRDAPAFWIMHVTSWTERKRNRTCLKRFTLSLTNVRFCCCGFKRHK